MTTSGKSRREFIKTSVAGAAGIAIGSRASSYAKILGSNDRVRIAFVGPGDRARDALIPSFLRLSGKLNFEPVITHSFDVKEADAAIQLGMTGDAGKILLTPHGFRQDA